MKTGMHRAIVAALTGMLMAPFVSPIASAYAQGLAEDGSADSALSSAPLPGNGADARLTVSDGDGTSCPYRVIATITGVGAY